MNQRTLMLSVTGAAAAMVAVLVGIMIWVYATTPRTGAFHVAFSLVDDKGHAVDQTMFKGHPAIVYFGYTHCPEVCPTTLLDVAGWLHDLGPQANDLKAYFFTVDPERDTQKVMHDYVSNFGDRITGVTGDPKEMKKVIDGWMIHASRTPSSDGNYHMSHTVSLLLVGADGHLKTMIPYETDSQEALATIKSSLLHERL
jgi:protein SCO1/2